MKRRRVASRCGASMVAHGENSIGKKMTRPANRIPVPPSSTDTTVRVQARYFSRAINAITVRYRRRCRVSRRCLQIDPVVACASTCTVVFHGSSEATTGRRGGEPGERRVGWRNGQLKLRVYAFLGNASRALRERNSAGLLVRVPRATPRTDARVFVRMPVYSHTAV